MTIKRLDGGNKETSVDLSKMPPHNLDVSLFFGCRASEQKRLQYSDES